MIPITYYPVATQRTLEDNRARLAGKPYAHYFDPQMFLREEVLSFQFPPMRVATMVHLVRATSDGFELRSRYWMADHVALKLPGFSLPIDGIANLVGGKRHFAGARLAYEQLLHDQSEFTHLAGFLAQIYREFGGQPALERAAAQ